MTSPKPKRPHRVFQNARASARLSVFFSLDVMRRLFAAFSLCLLPFSIGAAPFVTRALPQDGVFFTWTGFETTVIELKDCHFRYWFRTDAKGPSDPTYPLSGTFTVNDDTITLNHAEVNRPKWLFKTVAGVSTLWLPEAIQDYRRDKSYLASKHLQRLKQQGLGSVLV